MEGYEDGKEFHPACDQPDGDEQGTGGDCGGRGGADWASMRIQSSGVQVNATVQLRSKKNSREQQRQKIDSLGINRQFASKFP